MDRQEFETKMNELFEECEVEKDETGKLIADSIGYLKLVSSIEDEFDTELPDEFLAYNSLSNEENFLDLIYGLINK